MIELSPMVVHRKKSSSVLNVFLQYKRKVILGVANLSPGNSCKPPHFFQVAQTIEVLFIHVNISKLIHLGHVPIHYSFFFASRVCFGFHWAKIMNMLFFCTDTRMRVSRRGEQGILKVILDGFRLLYTIPTKPNRDE